MRFTCCSSFYWEAISLRSLRRRSFFLLVFKWLFPDGEFNPALFDSLKRFCNAFFVFSFFLMRLHSFSCMVSRRAPYFLGQASEK